MKIYVDSNYEVYTEETINEEIARIMEMNGYDGVLSYLANNFTESDIFAMLPENIQSEIFDDYKKTTIDDEFCEQEIPGLFCSY